MGRAKVTIADVARLAGVSLGTASHVLSGRVNVRDKTRQRVADAVKSLGYIPNFHARVLRQSASHIIGLSLPHRTSAFMSGLSETIERIGTDAGYSLMHVLARQDPETELRRIKELLRVQIDGLILHPSNTPQETLDFVRDTNVPVVLIDSSNEDPRFDRVVLDNRSTMKAAVLQLATLGHRRILFVCRRRDIAVTQNRLQGLKAAKAANPSVSYDCVAYGGDELFLANHLKAALAVARPPTAIIAGNSDMAALIIKILRDIKIRYPEDVSLLAFDEPDWSELVTPTLSVIRQPTAEIARVAWDMLMTRMHKPKGEPKKLMLTATIELRQSVQALKPSRRNGTTVDARSLRR